MSLIPAWVRLAILAALAAALAAVYFGWRDQQREIGRVEIRAEWNAERIKQQAAAMAADAEYRRIENRRQSMAAESQKRKDDEIRSVNARLADALGRLRNRPERPAAGSAVPVNPAPAAACTGAELYRPDAEFLIREAARADRIRAERDFYHDRYDALTK